MKTLKTGDEIILCIATRDQGHGLLRELAQLGCRVVLLTLDELRDAGWPHDALDDFQTMPGGLTEQQLANTVTYLARTRRFSRILALSAADMSIAAMLREHMRIPGMGRTTTQLFCDRLAMRARADQLGIRVPAYCAILNYDVLRAYMDSVPAPWVLQPRCVASTGDVQTLQTAEEVWRALEGLGDRQSDFILEQALAGDIVSIAGISANDKVVFSAVDAGGLPPLPEVEAGEVKSAHARLLPALGLVRGVSHARFLRSHASGKLYFLEVGTDPGDPSLVESVEKKYGINLWTEWARVEVGAMRDGSYRLP